MFPLGFSPPSLNDFQWSYNGLTMGAETPFGILKVEGLDLPALRHGDVPWPRDHGEALGLDLLGGRDVIIDFWMKTDGSSLQKSQVELAAAAVPRPNEEIPLWFQLPNLPIMCVMCRPRKKPIPIDVNYAAAQVATPELQLHATDPRIYGAVEEATVELTENFETGKKLNVNNEGNIETRPWFLITGEVEGPAVQSESISPAPTLRFTLPEEPKEATVPSDAQLLVKTELPHQVRLYPEGYEGHPNNWENHMNYVTWDSIWFDMIPGNNTLRYHADGETHTKSGTKLKVFWSSAWIL